MKNVPIIAIVLLVLINQVLGQYQKMPSKHIYNSEIDSLEMTHAISHLNDNSYKDQSSQMIILLNGKVVFKGDSVHKKHNIYSCSKSITSAVLGLAIANKKIKLNDFAWQYEPSLKELYPKAKIKHFASMTSGYSAHGNSRWNNENADWSWTPYQPEKPHFEPGKAFEYWDEAQMMYGKILTIALQKSLFETFDEMVAQKIELGPWEWGTEGNIGDIVLNNGCTGINWNAWKLAKIGQLYVNKGRWNDKQILSKKWIKKTTAIQVKSQVPVFNGDRKTVKGSGNYGFGWWLSNKNGLSPMPNTPKGSFYMSGLNHNVCMVIPKWNMVIVRMGNDGNPKKTKHEVWDEFIGLLNDALIK